jgi:hypothetical protein
MTLVIKEIQVIVAFDQGKYPLKNRLCITLHEIFGHICPSIQSKKTFFQVSTHDAFTKSSLYELFS